MSLEDEALRPHPSPGGTVLLCTNGSKDGSISCAKCLEIQQNYGISFPVMIC